MSSWLEVLKESAKCLADDPKEDLGRIADKDVRIRSRLDARQLLNSGKIAGWGKMGVVVSGPGGLCDDHRAAVISSAKVGIVDF